MKIDINKQYKTRDGQDVKIYTTEHKGEFPVVGAVSVSIYEWSIDGVSPYREVLDLIEAKPEQVVWVTVDGHGDVSAWHSEADAVACTSDPIHTIYRVPLTDDMVAE